MNNQAKAALIAVSSMPLGYPTRTLLAKGGIKSPYIIGITLWHVGYIYGRAMRKLFIKEV